ncbi:hypothetical protein D3C87_846620 [compost metagenome]
MLKKTIALAAGLSLLTGCIASREFGNLSSTLSKGTLLIRSLTVSNPANGNTEVTNFLGWISLSGKAPNKLERDGVEVPDSSGKLSSNSYQDKDDPLTNDLNPGQNYLYSLDFGESTATQSITPALLPDTRLTSTAPQGLNAVAAGASPTITWTRQGALPKGYIVTVAKMGDGFAGSSIGAGEPVYLAFLDAAAHPSSVTYGAPSDLAAITGDQLLSGFLAENPFFKPVHKALESGKTYAWTVVALDHDDAKTAFAIDKPDSIGIFTVQ